MSCSCWKQRARDRGLDAIIWSRWQLKHIVVFNFFIQYDFLFFNTGFYSIHLLLKLIYLVILFYSFWFLFPCYFLFLSEFLYLNNVYSPSRPQSHPQQHWGLERSRDYQCLFWGGLFRPWVWMEEQDWWWSKWTMLQAAYVS